MGLRVMPQGGGVGQRWQRKRVEWSRVTDGRVRQWVRCAHHIAGNASVDGRPPAAGLQRDYRFGATVIGDGQAAATGPVQVQRRLLVVLLRRRQWRRRRLMVMVVMVMVSDERGRRWPSDGHPAMQLLLIGVQYDDRLRVGRWHRCDVRFALLRYHVQVLKLVVR